MRDHLPRLVALIDTRPTTVADIFGPGFRTLTSWKTYWAQRGNSVSSLFQTQGANWTATDFQTLFIACWLHKPLEKGSFMIPLTDGHRRRIVEAAYAGLPTRWSSHLSKSNARTAGAGYQFLAGYSELLVQMESLGSIPQLFLKTEGHASVSLAHMSSFITKARTGQGNTASQALHDAAVQGLAGISLRAAENYDKQYESLLKHLGMKGTTHTVEDVLPIICRKLQQKARVLVGAEILDEVELALFVNARVEKSSLADLITDVIFPTLEQDQGKEGKFITKLRKALPALEIIAEGLDADGGDIHTASVPRVFHEVRVSLQELDQTVTEFIQEILDWEML